MPLASDLHSIERPFRMVASGGLLPRALVSEILDRIPIPTVAECGRDEVFLNAEARALWLSVGGECSNLPVIVDGKAQSLLDLRWPRGDAAGAADAPVIHVPGGDRYAIDGIHWDCDEGPTQWRVALLRSLDHGAGEGGLFTEKLNRLKAIVHEIRNMLTTAKETLALLHEGAVGDLNSDQRRFIRSAMDDVEGLVRSTVDLMSLWTTRAGVLRIMPRPVELQRVLDQAVLGVEPAAQKRDVSLCVKVAERLPVLIGDQELLVQALRNVLTNALRFTPPAGRICVHAYVADAQSDAGQSIEIEIQDSGQGIVAADCERIFQPFDRGNSGESAGGMGLGLAISRNIAAAHGGTLTVRNTPGEGACFVFRFPLAESGGAAWMARATQRAIDEVRPLSAPLAAVLLSFEADGPDSESRIHPDLLSAVQQLALQSLRPTDTVLAINDRLLLLIRGSSRSGAYAMVDRILESLVTMFSADGARFGQCNMIFGVAAYPLDGEDAETILARCESEMSKFPVGRGSETGV